MDNQHESSEKKETSSSLDSVGSNADSSNTTRTVQEIFKNKSPEISNYGYVDSLEEAMLLLKKYEQETTTKFSCYKSDKMFGSGDPFRKPRKIFFKGEKLPFDGTPFKIIGSKIFDCQHGPDRKKNEKAKTSTQKEGDHSFKGRRFLPQDMIKFGCPAKVLMSEVIKFPGYKILDNTERIRRHMSDRIRGDIRNGMQPQFERRIYINLPMETDHKHHVIGEV